MRLDGTDTKIKCEVVPSQWKPTGGLQKNVDGCASSAQMYRFPGGAKSMRPSHRPRSGGGGRTDPSLAGGATVRPVNRTPMDMSSKEHRLLAVRFGMDQETADSSRGRKSARAHSEAFSGALGQIARSGFTECKGKSDARLSPGAV